MNRQKAQESAVRAMARMIQTQAVLDRIISNTRADMREAVYNQLRPYLKFKPTPFWKMKFTDTAAA